MATLTHDDTYNIRQCLEGNANAFEPLVRRYQNAAFAVALGYFRDRTDAEDVVQDAFVAAYCKLSQLKDPAVFGSWFHRIVVNRCKEWSRRQKVGRLVRTDAHAGGAGDEIALANKAHQKYIESLEIWDEVEKLPEHYRRVVTLYYYTGFSTKEIAAFMDIPESTARGRLYQSRIRLRDALSSQEKETIAMSQIDVTEEVQDVVCKIAREDFEETIDMGDVENVVLYCGVSTEVEIVQAAGNQMIIKGSKIGLGMSKDEALTQAKEVAVSNDQVEDFFSSGPHDGELLLGVSSSNNVNSAITQRISDYWKHDLLNSWALEELSSGNRLIDVFPHLKNDIDVFPSLPEPARKSLGEAIRVTIHSRRAHSLETQKTNMDGEIEGVFSAMRWDETNVFGPSAYCHLSISVPRGKNISVFRPLKISADHLDASLMIFSCSKACALNEISGDVYLFNSTFTKLQDIGGKLYYRMYGNGGGRWRHNIMEPIGFEEGEITAVKGDVDIDVSQYELHASGLEGNVSIFNRYGTIHLKQTAERADSWCRLRSVSGDVNLSLHESIAPKTSLVIHSLCGSFNYGNARDAMSLYNTQSGGHWLTLSSTADYANADFIVVTESGNAKIDLFD